LQPQLVVVESLQGIRLLREYIKPFDFIFYDCETTGLDMSAEVMGFGICTEESKSYYVILHRWNTQTNKIDYASPEMMAEAKALITDLQDKQLVEHNGLFDSSIAESYFKVPLIKSLHTCTMVLAHLLNENRKIGLKELAKEYLGEDSLKEQEEMKASVLANGGTWTKKAKEMYKADPYLLAKYGAKDPWLTREIFYILIEDLVAQGLEDFFYTDESMPLLRGPTYQLNRTGLKVDQAKLSSLKATLQAECAEAKTFIHDEIAKAIEEKFPAAGKKRFNIGSNQQLAWLLFGKLGLEFGILSKEGKTVCRELGLRLPYNRSAKNDFIIRCLNSVGEVYQPEAIVNGKKKKAKLFKEPWAYISVNKTTLEKLAPKYKWIVRLLEHKKKTKLLTTYVKGIEQRIKYGIIRPSFLQTGTTGGRYSSRNPNFQNLPRDDKRIKSCIVSRPGRVFVGADFSQLEPRIFAYTSQDPRLLACFKTDDDFYSVGGIDIFDITDAIPKKEGSPDAFGIKYKSLRDDTKVIMLAATYGAAGRQLSPKTRKSVEETDAIIARYFTRFPLVKKMQLDAHIEAKTTGQVLSYFGRPRRLPEAKKINKIYGNLPHADLPYEARTILNLAVNHKIQCTGASIMNRASIKADNDFKEAGIDCDIVLQVHDSLVVECDTADAESVSTLLQNAMENAVHLEGIDLEAIPKIGHDLAVV
jgi:DNA polymerase-1